MILSLSCLLNFHRFVVVAVILVIVAPASCERASRHCSGHSIKADVVHHFCIMKIPFEMFTKLTEKMWHKMQNLIYCVLSVNARENCKRNFEVPY
jgi:hypothetical protein